MLRFNLFDNLQNHSAGIALVVISLMLARNNFVGQTQAISMITKKIEVEKKRNDELLRLEKAKKLSESTRQMINRKNLSMVINHINDFAKETLVTVVSIRPQTEKDMGDYIVYPYDISLSADGYHAVSEFISRVENSQDIFIIDDVTIKPDTQNESSGKNARLVVGMRINTYWMTE